jgi:alcohol dehydrogenase class IV
VIKGGNMHFYACPFLVFGDDALDYLKTVMGKRALIVTDKNIVKLGLADLVCSRLKEANIDYKIFDGVEPDPSLQTVKNAAKMAADYGPDWVIGLGGGSSLDAAKSAFILYCSPGLEPDCINASETYNSRLKAKLMGIPTTSGTGAEVTYGVVLTDTEYQRKIATGNYECVPDLVILDPAMVKGMPAPITAETGMDALTHAIEGYVAVWRTKFTDGPGLVAIRSVFEFLPRAYKDGSDLEAREEMQWAATQAGLCFGNGMAGVAHSLAHALGGIFHTSHGKAVGLYLPYTMEYIANGSAESKSRYAEIARFCGIAKGSDDECCKALIAKVRELSKSLKQPMSVKDVGVDRAKYIESMSGLVERAVSEAMTIAVTRVPDEADMEKLFVYSYDGKSVDF